MRVFSVIAMLALAALPAGAVTPQDVLTARAAALGGNRFAASGADAIFLNPAALGAQLRYVIQLDYGHTPRGFGDGFTAALADSLSNPSFPMGVAYRRVSIGENSSVAKGNIYDTAVAHRVSDHFLLGVRVTRLDYTLNGVAVKQFSGDLGALVKVGPVSLGAVGYRLLKVDAADAPIGVSTGLSVGDDRSFLVAGEVRWDWPDENARRSWSVAGEYLLGDWLPIRAAYGQDAFRGTKEVSAGLGYTSPEFAVDVSWRRDLVSTEMSWIFAAKLFVN